MKPLAFLVYAPGVQQDYKLQFSAAFSSKTKCPLFLVPPPPAPNISVDIMLYWLQQILSSITKGNVRCIETSSHMEQL